MSQAKLTSFEAETLHYKASTTYSFFNSMNMILPYTFTHMYANSWNKLIKKFKKNFSTW